ncbi:MAG: phosphoribosylglycinamide formyltransferase [Candidatus Dadabacteria bacterium]|nr:MAG: phosphoribosylglycinamide formyltransferase [Candidatus Dadabacteria bacterium]
MRDIPTLAVLISGRGSNLKSLIENSVDYRVTAIISNNPEAPGLKFGREYGIKTVALSRKDYPSLSEYKCAIFEETKKASPDLVALAGFMMILQPEFVKFYWGRLFNIHPALLPKYPGLDTHKRALEHGEKEHGCTVHYVDPGVDTGPIIAQAKVPVFPEDTVEALSQRVLEREHAIYPWVINSVSRGEIRLEGSTVYYSSLVKAEAKEKNFIIFTDSSLKTFPY